MRSSVDFWYFLQKTVARFSTRALAASTSVYLISLKAHVPGRHLWLRLTPPVAGALLRAVATTSAFLGARPPVDFLAVCLVLFKTASAQRALVAVG